MIWRIRCTGETGNILDSMTLENVVKAAMDAVENLIKVNKDNEDKYKGIPVEERS